MALIPSSIIVCICEGSFPPPLWKTPCSQPHDTVNFPKRRLWHTHHCISECIKMRVTRGYICFESGSPSYIPQTSTTLKFSFHRLKSRFLHPTPISLSIDENLDVCPVPCCVTERLATLERYDSGLDLSTCPLLSWKGYSQG